MFDVYQHYKMNYITFLFVFVMYILANYNIYKIIVVLNYILIFSCLFIPCFCVPLASYCLLYTVLLRRTYYSFVKVEFRNDGSLNTNLRWSRHSLTLNKIPNIVVTDVHVQLIVYWWISNKYNVVFYFIVVHWVLIKNDSHVDERYIQILPIFSDTIRQKVSNILLVFSVCANIIFLSLLFSECLITDITFISAVLVYIFVDSSECIQ